MPAIALLTDFGLDDWFVGTLHGVILNLNPSAKIVDLTHGIPPGDVAGGAFALAAAAPYFGPETIHVAVVDPGVGSARRAIGVRTRRGVFLGPDNGLLMLAATEAGIVETRELTNSRFFLAGVSRTFHGRDVFAPVAAHLSLGKAFARVGPRVDDARRLELPSARAIPGGLRGEVIYIDRFGNGITNLHAAWLNDTPLEQVSIRVGRRHLGPVRTHYQTVPAGQPLAVIGSTGRIEIVVNRGSAARTLGVRVGTPVSLRAE